MLTYRESSPRSLANGPVKIRLVKNPDQRFWNNVTDSNVLAAAIPKVKNYTDVTDIATSTVMALESSRYARYKTLLTPFLAGTDRVMRVDTEEVLWRLRADADFRYRSKVNLNPVVTYIKMASADDRALVVLDHDGLVDGDIIQPMADTNYSFVVSQPYGPPEPHGAGTRYQLQLQAGSVSRNVPRALFDAEQRWQKTGSIYGEGSSMHGSTGGAIDSYLELMLPLTYYRKKQTFTNLGVSTKIITMTFDANSVENDGKPMTSVVGFKEAAFMTEIKFETELTRIQGRSMGKEIEDPSSGLYRRGGPGLMELTEYCRPGRYNTTNDNIIDIVEYDMDNHWTNMEEFDMRDVSIVAGQYGVSKFVKDARKKESKLNLITQASDYQRNITNAMGSGSRQQAYRGNNRIPLAWAFDQWGMMEIKHHPMLDSQYISGDLKIPGTTRPASSGYYWLVDSGMRVGAESNIRLLQKIGAEGYQFICGTWSPRGVINMIQGQTKFVSVHTGAFYDMTYENSYGVMVYDLYKLKLWKPTNVYK